MNLVPHRRKTYRTQFRKLGFGELYFLASNLATAPFVKSGIRTRANGFDNTTGKLTATAIADTSVAVVTIPRFLLVHD